MTKATTQKAKTAPTIFERVRAASSSTEFRVLADEFDSELGNASSKLMQLQRDRDAALLAGSGIDKAKAAIASHEDRMGDLKTALDLCRRKMDETKQAEQAEQYDLVEVMLAETAPKLEAAFQNFVDAVTTARDALAEIDRLKATCSSCNDTLSGVGRGNKTVSIVALASKASSAKPGQSSSLLPSARTVDNVLRELLNPHVFSGNRKLERLSFRPAMLAGGAAA